MAKKKDNRVWLWVGGIAAVLWLSWRGMLSRVKYRVAGLIPVRITAEEAVFNLILQLYNPSGVKALIGNMYANVYINGARVGVVSYPVNRYLWPRQVNQFTVQVTAHPGALASVVWQQLVSGYFGNMDFAIRGYIEVDGHQLPVRLYFIMEDFIRR